MINKTLWAAAAFAVPMIASAGYVHDIKHNGTATWTETGYASLLVSIDKSQCPTWCPPPEIEFMVYDSNVSQHNGDPVRLVKKQMALAEPPNNFRVSYVEPSRRLYTWIEGSRLFTSWSLWGEVTSVGTGSISRAGVGCDKGSFAPVMPFDIRVGETVSVVLRHTRGTCGGVMRIKGRSDDVIKFDVDELLQPHGDLGIKVTGLRPGNAIGHVTAEYAWK